VCLLRVCRAKVGELPAKSKKQARAECKTARELARAAVEAEAKGPVVWPPELAATLLAAASSLADALGSQTGLPRELLAIAMEYLRVRTEDVWRRPYADADVGVPLPPSDAYSPHDTVCAMTTVTKGYAPVFMSRRLPRLFTVHLPPNAWALCTLHIQWQLPHPNSCKPLRCGAAVWFRRLKDEMGYGVIDEKRRVQEMSLPSAQTIEKMAAERKGGGVTTAAPSIDVSIATDEQRSAVWMAVCGVPVSSTPIWRAEVESVPQFEFERLRDRTQFIVSVCAAPYMDLPFSVSIIADELV
jgi:hypothetical protein